MFPFYHARLHSKLHVYREEGETNQMSQERTDLRDQFSQSLSETSVKTEGTTQIIGKGFMCFLFV